MVEEAAPPRPAHIFDHGLFGGRDRRPGEPPGAPVDESLKRGLVDATFEDLKIVSEKELYDIILAQKNFFEVEQSKDSNETDIRQVRLEQMGDHFARLPRRVGGDDPFGQHLNRMLLLGRVDELDGDFDQFFRDNMHFEMGHERPINIFGGGLNPGGFRADNRPLYGHPHYAPANQGGEMLQYDNGNYNNLLRQELTRYQQTANEQFGQQILLSGGFWIVEEEESKD